MADHVTIFDKRVTFVKKTLAEVGDGTEYCMEVTVDELAEIMFRVKDAWFTSGSVIGTVDSIPWEVYDASMTTELPRAKRFYTYNEEWTRPEEAESNTLRGYCVPEYCVDVANGVSSAHYGAAYDAFLHANPSGGGTYYYYDGYEHYWGGLINTHINEVYTGIADAYPEAYSYYHSPEGLYAELHRDLSAHEIFMWQDRIGSNQSWPACAFTHYVSSSNIVDEIPG